MNAIDYFDISHELFAADHAIKDYDESHISGYAESKTQTATAFGGSLRVNRTYGMAATLYTINDNNYIKLRDMAAMLGMFGWDLSVGYDGENGTITITDGEKYSLDGSELAGMPPEKTTSAVLPALQVSYNGSNIFIMAYSIGGSTYFRLRDLVALFGFTTRFDGRTQTIFIDSAAYYHTPGGEYW